jgi:hypothetical protein
VPVVSGQWGSDVNGTWNGMIGMVKRRVGRQFVCVAVDVLVVGFIKLLLCMLIIHNDGLVCWLSVFAIIMLTKNII